MKAIIDTFIETNIHLRGSYHMDEQLKELIRINGFNYFDAVEYCANHHGYLV